MCVLCVVCVVCVVCVCVVVAGVHVLCAACICCVCVLCVCSGPRSCRRAAAGRPPARSGQPAAAAAAARADSGPGGWPPRNNRVGQHVAIGIATERSATTRFKDALETARTGLRHNLLSVCTSPQLASLSASLSPALSWKHRRNTALSNSPAVRVRRAPLLAVLVALQNRAAGGAGRPAWRRRRRRCQPADARAAFGLRHRTSGVGRGCCCRWKAGQEAWHFSCGRGCTRDDYGKAGPFLVIRLKIDLPFENVSCVQTSAQRSAGPLGGPMALVLTTAFARAVGAGGEVEVDARAGPDGAALRSTLRETGRQRVEKRGGA